MVKQILNQHEADSVSHAVRSAEARTSAEIVTIIAPQSDAYVFPALTTGIVGALAVSVLVYWLGLLSNFYSLLLVQMLVLLSSFVFLQSSGWARLFTSRTERQKQVRRYASEQFFTRGLHTTRDRNGLLIFISAQERCVELIVDISIRAQIEDTVWQGIVDTLVVALGQKQTGPGLVAAVQSCAEVLGQYFPIKSGDRNELPDTVLEIQA